MSHQDQMAADPDVPREATSTQLAGLRVRVLETMATVKQGAAPWHSASGA